MFDKTVYLSLFKDNFIQALGYLCQETPTSLFKFYSLGNKMDEEKLSTLKDDKLWVELFLNQNDPFEMINLDIDEESVKPKYTKDGQMLIDKNDLFNAYQNHMNYYKKRLKTASLCDVMATNISMWAYYTNNHQGFCCEYEPLSRDLDLMKPLRPVLYEKRIVKTRGSFVEQLAISGLNSLFGDSKQVQLQQAYHFEIIKLLASCKDESWAHEREYRTFYLGKDDGTGESVRCSELNLKLKAIYAGVNCSDENKEQLKQISEYLKVEFHAMKASSREYMLIE